MVFKKNFLHFLEFLGILIFISFWIVLLCFFSPEKIVGFVGVNNSYFIIFVLGLIAGVSSFFAAPFYTSLITFSAGGSNILILALVAGFSITITHSLYYYLGFHSRGFFSKKYSSKLNKASSFLKKRQKYIPLIAILYFAFTPFPNELILTPLGVINYSFKKLVVYLLIGNIVLMFLISLLAGFGFDLLKVF
mgnify:CR=1 FL=1